MLTKGSSSFRPLEEKPGPHSLTLRASDSFRSESLPDVGLQKAFENLMYHRKTPTTVRIVAGIKADGVEEWVSSRGGRWNGTTEEALKFAKQLREGGKV